MLAEALGGRGFGPGGSGGKPLPAPPPPKTLREGDIELGRASNGDPVGLHLGKLIEGRLLIQGNSGAGKSMLLRRIFEQAFGKVQLLLIDPEGEFSTLAEEFDVAVFSAFDVERIGGRKFTLHMREHRYSAVLDLSDAATEDRLQLVADITEGLIDAPERFWFPMLVLIDEAQTLAPHYDTGDVTADIRKRAISALANMMVRGRKRGVAGVIASARIAETSKAVVSKATNVIVGRTIFDRDLERAGAALGLTAGSSKPLRTLSDGEFMCLGPALGGPKRIRFKAGPVLSRHKGDAPEIIAPPTISAAESAALLREIPTIERDTERAASSVRAKKGPAPRQWQKEEDEIIRDGYEAKLPVLRICQQLVDAGYRSVSVSGLSTRAHALGLVSARAAVAYCDEEDEIIRDAYAREIKLIDIVGLLAEKGYTRGRVAIQMRAIQLGITRDRVNYWTEPEKKIAIEGLEDGTPYREIIQNLKAAGYERGITAIMKFAQRNGYSRKVEGWTAEDIEQLRQLYEKKTPVKEIAEALGKPISGVRAKASNLGLKQRTAWTEKEYKILQGAHERGETLAHAAQLIGRPYPNVARVAKDIGLSFSKRGASK
ncbi:DUF87 domain-containing protein [Parvibaculum sp.]|uniref:helicase HerA domain-containing protein n=1 Tax=Parvibaculum sp. TaxID=2024848 RepID=UPI001DD1E4E8|nr:DUF87 domain-containing protein [Parvibaculum sp.]MBX3490852.1 DUF87 domain-containing protein [Parvibaculum sp.]